MSDEPIRVLHLSDFHFKTGNNWDADPVLRALTNFIQAEVESGLAPDLVAITGDLAFAGKREDYELALDWLEMQLWPRLGGLPRDRLLLIPGNHDVERGKINKGVRLMQDGLLKSASQEDIAELLGDEDNRFTILKRHAAYLSFVESWLGVSQELPWWQRAIEIRGCRLHFAGLDSAWMACGDGDRGTLLLGRYQLTQTVDNAQADGATWRIALVHHPWDYLAEFDYHAARALIHQRCDLLLRGHLHVAQSERVVPPDPSRACLEIAGGCVYEASRYPNAFQWIELSPAVRRVRVHFRAWTDNAWAIDRNQPKCPEGWAEFDLEAPAHSEPPLVDFRKYLQDLWDETAYIEIRGLAAGPRAHLFPIEDLYIELRASGGAMEPPVAATRSEPQAAHLKDALLNHRLVIIGDPGCGKTTFLRWVTHCLVGDRLGLTSGAARLHLELDRARLPVLVSIADWLEFISHAEARGDGPALKTGAQWMVQYLSAAASDANQELTAADFLKQLQDGECVLLLDGLDEAPDARQRQRAVNLIKKLARAFPDCPMVLTSRPAAYEDKMVLAGFAHSHINELDAFAIQGFLDRWSRALFPDSGARAQSHKEQLAAALASRREIRDMARNAVMLTALAVLHWNEKQLPEQRAALYESILRWLLEARERRPGREKTQRCQQLLSALALSMQNDRNGRQIQVTRRWAAERLSARFGGDDGAIDRAEMFLAEEEIDSGIIVRRGLQLRFWHLTFLEYLAAQALAGWTDEKRTELLLEADGSDVPVFYQSEWRETVLLLAGVLYLQGQDKVDNLVSGVLDRLGDNAPLPRQAKAAGLLGAMVQDLSSFGYRPLDSRYARLLESAMAVFDARRAATIPLEDRIAVADALAQAEDPRLGWARPGRWVLIAGGEFVMGAQKADHKAPGHDLEADASEAPIHSVILDPFQIGRFPVTVAEYAEFADDDNATDARWWQAGGRMWGFLPYEWEAQQARPSRPVVNVSWYQATAFCAWLTEKLTRLQGVKREILLPVGHVVRLPTEAEWEFTARGPGGRRYPWGNQPPGAEHANFKGRVGRPSPVGIFPFGTTPEGVVDMAGNTWEWCLDRYAEGFYRRCAKLGTMENPVSGGESWAPRVQRGGSFGLSSRFLRSSARHRDQPVLGHSDYGFRCVLALPRPFML